MNNQKTSWNILSIVTACAAILALVVALAAGGVAIYLGGRKHGFARYETGRVPVELIQQTLATGTVEFSRPFGRRPFVFICEDGHAGVFLACKTDDITPSGFTWAVGGPLRRQYQTELSWIAFEPE